MESRLPYEVLIELHSGGALQLALSDQDKILVIRSFVLSLPLQDQIVQDFLVLLDDYEQKSKPIDIWKHKLDGAKAAPCEVCGGETRNGGNGEFSLGREHNNWRSFLKLRRVKWAGPCFIASIGRPRSRIAKLLCLRHNVTFVASSVKRCLRTNVFKT